MNKADIENGFLVLISLHLRRDLSVKEKGKPTPQAKWKTGPDCTILAATAYGWPVMLLTDEGHATTYFTYSTAAKGTEMTLLRVESDHWRAAELFPDSALPPNKVIW